LCSKTYIFLIFLRRNYASQSRCLVVKIINIGILAHVDAGKTTVSENLLYKSGVIKAVGRVDKGSTVTDSMAIEKERGITVRSFTVSFNWNNTKINLLDTPGHVDFIAEVERSIQVLDGAILVLSAKEGVQTQTRVLFNTLQKLQIPTLIFINKLDRKGIDLPQLYTNIKEQLSPNVIKMQSVAGEGTRDIVLTSWSKNNSIHEEVLEKLCDLDTTLMSKYLNEEEVLEREQQTVLQNGVSQCRLYPIFHGAALLGLGIDELLNGIERYISGNSNNLNQELAALVYKIDRDEKFQKKIYIRIFQGKIAIRDNVKILNKDDLIKIKRLEKLEQGKIIEVSEIEAGDIGILSSVEGLRIGDVLGIWPSHMKQAAIAVPTLTATVLPVDSTDRMKLIKVLHDLMEEDPFLSCQIDQQTEEITIHLFGEVQMEVVKSLIKEKYLIDIEFNEPRTLYKERPKHVGLAAIHMEEQQNPFNASIVLSVEPAPLGAGQIYESKVSYGYLTKPFQNAVCEGVRNALLQGFWGWEITDIKVCFTGAYYDSVKSTPADFRDLAPLVLMEAILKAGTEILEPMMNYSLIVPQDVSSKAMADLRQMRAIISASYIKENEMVFRGKIPVETSKSYSVLLASYTGGRGIFSLDFSGYELYTGKVVLKHRTGDDSINRVRYLLQKSNTLKT
jgi:ribosomal protection tetracycline resistance protein